MKVQSRHWMGWVAALGLLVVGCGPPKQAGESNTPSTDPDDDVAGVDVSEEELEPTVIEPDMIEFDEEAAQVVLKRGANKARECSKVTEGVPSGEVEVEAIFDGKTGQIIDVIPGMGLSSADDNALNCIKRSFLGEIIPPFKGRKNVTHTFELP